MERDLFRTTISIKLSWPLERNFSVAFFCETISENKNFPNAKNEKKKKDGLFSLKNRSVASIGEQRLRK